MEGGPASARKGTEAVRRSAGARWPFGPARRRICDAKLRFGGEVMEVRVRCSTLRTSVLATLAAIAAAAVAPSLLAQSAALKGASTVSGTPRPTVRDSAGITIVENPRVASP